MEMALVDITCKHQLMDTNGMYSLRFIVHLSGESRENDTLCTIQLNILSIEVLVQSFSLL